MMRGATSSCLFIFICSMAALCESSTTVEDPVTPTVSSSSNTSSFTSSTLLSSLDSTSPGKSTFMTTTQSNMAIGSTIPDSRSNTESSNSTSAISSSTTDLMLSMSASSASVPIVTPTNLTSEAFSNANTVEAMTTALQSTVETTNFSVNQTNTPINVPSSMINTTQPTSVTDDVTQGSTFIHTTIATTFNASSNLTTASVYTNITVPTTNGTTVVDASKTTVSSSPATKVTTTGTVTVPVNTTGLGTDVPHSSWSTQSQKTSTTHSTVQCQQSSCPPGSKCVEFFQSYTCRCPIGQAMQGDNCVTVKTFPGTLYLKMDFKSGMNDVHSEIFLETSRRIEEEMKKFFKNDPSYYQSIVRKLEKGSVKASVDNIFSLSSNVTEESVNQYIKAGIKNCSSCTAIKESDNYTSESICKQNVCDANTSKCKTDDGIVECTCLIGYYKFADSDRSCKACPNGLKLQNGSCVKCPFGYNGFNCDKSYLLALVVVSCVLGGILLFLLLALMGICLRLRSGAYSSSSGSHDYIMWPKSEMPKIPRATMHWDGNQLEMQENGSTSSLNDIHREGGRMPEKNDDLKTFKGKQQSRYTYLCQGQENPYYISDEKKPEYL